MKHKVVFSNVVETYRGYLGDFYIGSPRILEYNRKALKKTKQFYLKREDKGGKKQ